MSATEVLARLRIDAASEDFEGAQLCRIHSNRAERDKPRAGFVLCGIIQQRASTDGGQAGKFHHAQQ